MTRAKAETDTTLPLCDLAVDDIDALSYAGNNVEVSLLKGSDGWLLADDPSLPRIAQIVAKRSGVFVADIAH